VKKDMHFVPVETLQDVLKVALPQVGAESPAAGGAAAAGTQPAAAAPAS
jgi:hypothetical protein